MPYTDMHIATKADLKHFLEVEQKNYLPSNMRDRIFLYLINDERVRIWKYQKRLRICEYYYNNRHRSFIHYALFLLNKRVKNSKGQKSGIFITENCCDIGLVICHEGGIVINGYATIGKNLCLHGHNCIGNRGTTGIDDAQNWAAPVIGDNVQFGVGACAIGGIHIDDNTLIGAGAVVVKNTNAIGTTLVGIPAKAIA